MNKGSGSPLGEFNAGRWYRGNTQANSSATNSEQNGEANSTTLGENEREQEEEEVDDVDDNAGVEVNIDIETSADAKLFNVTAIDGEDTWLGEPVPFGAWDE